MKLFAVAVIFAVALQGSVYARPEPLGLSDLLSVFGVPQDKTTVDTLASLFPAVSNIAASLPAATPTTSTTTTAAAVPSNIFESFYKGFSQGIANVFSFLPLPKAASSSNPIFNILNAFIASIQQSEAVADNTAANSLVGLLGEFVSAIDTQPTDPLTAVLGTVTDAATALVKSTLEVTPAFVTSIMFGSSAQTRDIFSFSLDVAAGLSGFVEGIQQWIASTFNIATSTVAYLFSGLNLAIDAFPIVVQNVTSIGTNEGGVDAMFDIIMQIVAAADLIVDEANLVISTVANTLITSTDGTIEGLTSAVLGYVNPALSSVISTLSPNCATATTNTVYNISMGLANTVETCARSEANTWTGILTQTSTALEQTNVVVSGLKGVFQSVLRFDVWGFFANAWAIMGNVASAGTSYSLIVPMATEAVANIQTRFPTCMGVQAGNAFLSAFPVGVTMFTCL